MTYKRTDANQTAIVELFRRLGWSVAITSSLGHGYPDLTCGKHGLCLLVEVKDGEKPPSARRLTPDEQKFKDAWRGTYVIVESHDDVIRINKAADRHYIDHGRIVI